MSKKDKKQIRVLDYIVDLLRRYESGEVGDSMKQQLDSWTPDITDMKRYPMDEQKATVARSKVSRHVATHIRHNRKGRTIRPMWRNRYQRYAAIAAIVLLLGGGAWMAYRGNLFQLGTNLMADAHKAWTTDDKHRTTLSLPDGTVVQVNADSRFEIVLATFNKQKREVWLTGEAFFDVAKNPEKPFIIHTGRMQTTVRGTSFNVKAYPQLSEYVVSVRSGKVEVSEGAHTYGLLTHNKQLAYNTANRTVQITESNWEDAAGWTKGRLVLNGAGVEELRLRLRQQFGAEVTCKGGALAGQRITGTFDPSSKLTDVMTTIATIYNIHYSIKKNHIIITSLSTK